jgi:hypothetical protein
MMTARGAEPHGWRDGDHLGRDGHVHRRGIDGPRAPDALGLPAPSRPAEVGAVATGPVRCECSR